LGIAAVSYAAGPALAAAADPRIADRVDYVVALGGYHDAAKVITYLTTGAYRADGETAWRQGDSNRRAGWIFMAANAERWPDVTERSVLLEIARQKADGPDRQLGDLDSYLGADAQALVALFDNRDPDAVPMLLAALPPDIQQSLVALSPSERDLAPLDGELLLVHGLDDTVVPYTESLDLGDQVPDTEIFLVTSFTHVDPDGVDWQGYVTMVRAVDAILARGLGPEPAP
jgi:pimeloyl-ACP methyl ester carboxylesterase